MVASNEVKIERIRRGLTQIDIANEMGISVTAYSYKERDPVKFTDKEKRWLCDRFSWEIEKANVILYDGLLKL